MNNLKMGNKFNQTDLFGSKCFTKLALQFGEGNACQFLGNYKLNTK